MVGWRRAALGAGGKAGWNPLRTRGGHRTREQTCNCCTSYTNMVRCIFVHVHSVIGFWSISKIVVHFRSTSVMSTQPHEGGPNILLSDRSFDKNTAMSGPGSAPGTMNRKSVCFTGRLTHIVNLSAGTFSRVHRQGGARITASGYYIQT